MKQLILGSIIIVLFLFIGCQQNPTEPVETDLSQASLNKAPSASATGSGQATLGEWRTFSFNAQQTSNGYKGQFQLKSRASDVTLHGTVTYLVVVGNVAYVGGYIKNTNNPNYKGWYFVFSVIDNGEGSAAASDQISAVYFANTWVQADVEAICNDGANEFLGTYFDIEAGNIQVHN